MAVSPICPRCRYVHYGSEVRAVGRFVAVGPRPRGYYAFPDGPVRLTRAAARRDACDRNLARDQAASS